MKFQPGTFLELDDLEGGRKVVMVGKDGVTYWDSIQTDKVTPLVIHPVMNPVELGTAVQFVKAKRLNVSATRVRESLRTHMDSRVDDALFIMRVLWVMSSYATGEGWAPNDSTLQAAMKAAEVQEATALRQHQHAERFCEMAAA
jgi:hypothetical protein